MYKNLINKDIFVIPVGVEFGKADDAINIVYSPFTDNALVATPEFAQEMEAYIVNPDGDFSEGLADAMGALLDLSNRKKCAYLAKSPEDYTRMAILPNNVCNFKCSYCYSAQGRSGKVMTQETMKGVIDWFINPDRISVENKLAISILGGGEPLLSWNLVKFCLEYANERAAKFGYPRLDCNLVTNGSILNQEIIDTFKKFRVPISVSFEIMEEIQALQRGHYEKVAANIDWLISEGIYPQLRATITNQNVRMMKRMVEEVLQRFPKAREVMMEYVTDADLMTTAEQVREFYKLYIDNFFEAHEYGASHGLLVDCSAYRNFHLLIERFCPGDNTITPDGEISICSRIGAPHDAGYDDCIYGKIDANGKATIDRDKFLKLIGLNVHHYDRCKNCFAKWHCAGGCLVHKYAYNETIFEEICTYIRSFTRKMLLKRIDKEYIEACGTTLKDAFSKL